MPTPPRPRTLEQVVLDREGTVPSASGAFSRLLRDLSIAAKTVASYVRRAGLLDVLGATGEVNVQGEAQQRLDAIAHDEFVRALRLGGECALVVSEEADEPVVVEPRAGGDGRYVVFLDPLDGSSNVDVNVSVGTIFSVYRLRDGEAPTVEAALRPGREQAAAGYVVYGSSTTLVLTTGDGVDGFTLDPSVGEFLLSHPGIRTPPTGRYYSVDQGNAAAFEPGLARLLHWMAFEQAEPSTYKTRYVGSFVADVHRNLLKGGLYVYPATAVYPEGKLRLMYEANPVALLVEQAGGRASDGVRRVLDVEPVSVHQRTAVYAGSREMVGQAEAFLRGEAPS